LIGIVAIAVNSKQRDSQVEANQPANKNKMKELRTLSANFGKKMAQLRSRESLMGQFAGMIGVGKETIKKLFNR